MYDRPAKVIPARIEKSLYSPFFLETRIFCSCRSAKRRRHGNTVLFSYAVVSFFTPNTFLKKKPRKPLSFLTTTTFMSQASCLKLSAYERYGQDDHNDRHDPYHKAVRKQTGTSESQRKIKSAFPLALIIASYHMFFTA
jgi:hypothetical protein